MDVGMIGLGRMGTGLSQRLLQAGHRVVAYDVHEEPVQALAREGACPAGSLAELASRLPRPRAVWLMVPAGKPVESVLEALLSRLDAGDVVVDGGNSSYKDSVARATRLGQKGVRFLDVGTCGGIWGLREGG